MTQLEFVHSFGQNMIGTNPLFITHETLKKSSTSNFEGNITMNVVITNVGHKPRYALRYRKTYQQVIKLPIKRLKTQLSILGEIDALGLIEHVGLGFCKTYVIPRLSHLHGTLIPRNWYQLGQRYMFMSGSFSDCGLDLMHLGKCE